MATPNFQTGIDATSIIDSFELPTISWTVNDAAEIVRFRNSLTKRKTIKKPTYTDAPFTIVFDWDKANQVYGDAPVIRAGMIVEDVSLYVDQGTEVDDVPGADAERWFFPEAVVVNTPMRVDVAGKAGMSVNMENSGDYFAPGETITSG